jgi:hypothetical protein
MTPLEAITKIIEERKERRTYPFCALISDVWPLCNLSDAEFTKEIERLKTSGIIVERQTVNSVSYYLDEDT